MARCLSIALISSVLGVLGFSMGPTPPQDETKTPFHDQLKKAATEYRQYGRVDDEMRWAPYLCRMPLPGMAHVSASKDEKTHGRKLYSLYIKQRDAYLALDPKKPAPIGQVLVKQSWIPEEVVGKQDDLKRVRFPIGSRVTVELPPDPKTGKKRTTEDTFHPYASKDGKTYKAGKQGDLFIMLKLDPKTPGTDEGWVYGTVSPDGQKVTSAGRVESCMKCHQETKSDRQFGLRP